MWSGPRNLSTAMMYSFGVRSDFTVMDEPFYAAYLAATGADHPMRSEILQTHETDTDTLNSLCSRGGSPHLYMKHMPHHMIDGMPLNWAAGCVHIHLLRHPARVIASYGRKRSQITLDDIGILHQERIHAQLGGLVIDSADILAHPEAMLRRLCTAIDLPFDPAMLSWPAGPRPWDGIWARHWYNAVHKSTGFASEPKDLPRIEPQQQHLLEAALPIYEAMAATKI
ncbi:MAG: HAD family hydrolase [Pseudomonadota bacterium]